MSIVAAVAALAALAPQDPPPQPPLPPPAMLPPVTVTEAPEQVPNPAAAPTAEEDPMDRVTCRSEPVVGSRFNSRVCMTRREWAQRRQDSQDLARQLDVQNSNRGRVYAPTTGGGE